MSQPKLLPPSLRPHKRYIAFEIISEQPVQYNEFLSAVWSSTFNFLGDLGSADAKIWFVHNLYDEKGQRGLIKCTHDSVERIRGVLSLVRMSGETKTIVKILGVTGTIKSAKTKYLNIKDLRTFTRESE
jgi:ribonuclease P/MRP protein subunit POP5